MTRSALKKIRHAVSRDRVLAFVLGCVFTHWIGYGSADRAPGWVNGVDYAATATLVVLTLYFFVIVLKMTRATKTERRSVRDEIRDVRSCARED